jgi:hypothetical protein
MSSLSDRVVYLDQVDQVSVVISEPVEEPRPVVDPDADVEPVRDR